ERGVMVSELGIRAEEVAQIAVLRERGAIGSNAADELFGVLSEPGRTRGGDAPPPAHVEKIARERGLLTIRDDAAMDRWIDQVLAANEKIAAEIRGGKMQAA